MTRLKLFLKRKLFYQSKTDHRTSTLHSSSVHHSTLPNYSNVNTSPIDTIVDNTPVNDDTDSPIKVYSKTITFFLRHFFKLKAFCFHLSYRTLACQIQLSFLTCKTLQN